MSCTQLRRIIQTLYLITIKITQPTLLDHIAHPCQTPSGQRATGGGGGTGSEGSGGYHINSYKKGIYWLNDYEQYHCIIIESNNSATVHLVVSFYGYMDQTYREQCEERRQFSKLDVITIAIRDVCGCINIWYKQHTHIPWMQYRRQAVWRQVNHIVESKC